MHIPDYPDYGTRKLTRHLEVRMPRRAIGICCVSDFHIGNELTDHDRLHADIQRIIETPDVYGLVGGDPTDNFILGGKLQAAGRDSQIMHPDDQWTHYRRIMEILVANGAVIAAGKGNHDEWTKSASGVEGIVQALQGLELALMDEDCYLDVWVGEQHYLLYRKHDPVGASFNDPCSGMKRRYQQGERYFDVGISEHHHEMASTSVIFHSLRRHFIATGSYKPPEDYSRKRGFMHGGPATPTVVLHPDERKIVVFEDLDDADVYLRGVNGA